VDSLWNVDQKFGKEGRSNAHWPRLREGVTYSITAGIAAATYSDFLDVNHGNDNVTFTFRIPD
jgi:isocitrate lyase